MHKYDSQSCGYKKIIFLLFKMNLIKDLGNLIEQATHDSHSDSPLQIYDQIMKVLNSRADMPKHSINAISKRLSTKNKKILYLCFDLLEFLSYRTELSLYSQISTKQFLLKTSGILMSKDVDPMVQQKILQTIRVWEELFRPHEDLLPMFFQFYAGVLRKEFPVDHDYVSKHKPKDYKIIKKVDKKPTQSEGLSKPKKQKIKPTRSQQQTFEQIRQKLILTNEILDNTNPAEGVKGNQLLIEMIQDIKECEKKVNKSINENPNENIMELALAANDDIYITYRRYKDLQKNRKPEPFILTELESDRVQTKKVQQHPVKSPSKEQSQKKKKMDIFNDFDEKPQQKVTKTQVKHQTKPKQVDLMGMDMEPTKMEKKVSDLMDLTLQTGKNPSETQQSSNIFDLLGSTNQQVKKQEPSNNFQSNSINMQTTVNFESSNYPNVANQYGTEADIGQYDGKTMMDKITDLTDMLKKQ